jgi:phospholipid N-methyltransferase
MGLESAKVVVEFGPGTGAVTPSILRRIPGDCTFWAIERSDRFVKQMRERHPNVRLYHDTAENVKAHCEELGVAQVDCIVSGLPFASFPEALQRSVLDAVISVLKPGGKFATFGYWTGLLTPAGKRFRKLFAETFDEVGRSQTVWLNVPPAFVYRGVLANGNGNNGRSSSEER